jgi:hypothetical protein
MRGRGVAGIFLLAASLICGPLSREADAQRHSRSSARRVIRAYGHYYHPYFGFYYGPFYGPYYGSFYGSYFHPYGVYSYDAGSAVRVQVEPVETEVYVDGYFAGIADDFDGFFQRLRLPPGEHEIQLTLEGYRSMKENIYLSAGSTYRLRHQMEPLGPGETAAPRPEPRDPPRASPPEPVAAERADLRRRTAAARFGRLAIRIHPSDAQIWIDGDRWPSTPGEEQTVIHLRPGRYRVEIRKEGREPFETEVEVLPGETTSLNVKLADAGHRGRPELLTIHSFSGQ